jgi:hypothetical protein
MEIPPIREFLATPGSFLEFVMNITPHWAATDKLILRIFGF